MPAETSMPARPPHFAAFVMNTTGHIIQGTWRRPNAGQTNFNDLDHWVRLVQILEKSRFGAMAGGGRRRDQPRERGDPGSCKEFADHVAPVLQRRGLMQTEYAEGTLRDKLFGRGDRLPGTHPAARYRGAFTPQPA